MTRSKKIFLGFSALFIVIMIVIAIDISSKTTFPGSSDYSKESVTSDTVKSDSLHQK